MQFTVGANIAQPIGTVVRHGAGRTVIDCVEGRTISFTLGWNRPVRPGVRSAIRVFAINGDHVYWTGPWQQTQAGWRITR